MKILSSILVFIFSILFFSSCKNGGDSTIPGTYVDEYIYLSEPGAVQLNAVGGWIYYQGGWKGLMIYRRSQNEFVAYDRKCTYDPDASCSLQIQSSGITVVDSCCGSQFNLVYGSVTKGPASQAMIQYKTNFDGNVVHVYN